MAHPPRFESIFEPARERTSRIRFAAWAAFPIAILVAIAAIGGIAVTATYARETASWTAQGVGQDWVNLVVVVPTLLATAVLALRGSAPAALVLGGALLYTAYSFVVYAFAVHFNWLFLVYCGALGTSVFALVHLTRQLAVPHRDGLPIRSAAATLFGIAGVFGTLWLAQVLPAIATGTDPTGLAEVGLPVNPVHVLDLALLLPALVVIGVSLLRRHRFGLVTAPIALTFSVLMALAIGAMVLVMHQRGLALDVVPSIAMAIIALTCAAVLIAFLLRVQRD